MLYIEKIFNSAVVKKHDINLKYPLIWLGSFSAHTSLCVGLQFNPLVVGPFDPVIGFKDTIALHCTGFRLFSTVALVSPD